MLSSRLFNISNIRLLSKSTQILSRFPNKYPQVPKFKKIIKNKSPQLAETYGTRPVRPLSDILKIVGFTAFTGVSAYTIALLADNNENELYLKEQFKNFSRSNWSWASATAVEKNTIIFFATNTAVFLAWRIAPLLPFMTRFFTNSFASKSLYLPMILSAFSHRNFIHFGLNMYVANTFIQTTMQNLIDPGHFWAFYITAAAFSSCVSLIEKAFRRTPIRSLGASGALMAVLCYLCMIFPDMRLQMIFAPGIEFSAQNAVYGMIAFDAICLLLGFKMFDHAAHLGGQLFGWFYAKHGEDLFWGDYAQFLEKFKTK